MLGDLDADPAAVLADAIAHARTSLKQIQEYLVHPARHPGGTNETSRKAIANREEICASAAGTVQFLLEEATESLDYGRREAAAILVVNAQAFLMDSLAVLLAVSAYETLRVDAEAEFRNAEEEARRRSSNAAKGAPKPRFSDEALQEFIRSYEVRHSKRRGAIKAAGLHFSVSDTAIRSRLSKIRTG